VEFADKRTKAVPAHTVSDPDIRATPGSLNRLSPVYAVGFLILAMIVVGCIWHDLRTDYLNTLAYWKVWLSSSADDQVRLGGLWLEERRTDTMAIAENPRTIRLLTAAGGRSEVAEIRRAVERQIGHIASVNEFLGGAVGDGDCRIVAQSDIWPEMAQGIQESCQAVEGGTEFHVYTFGMEHGHVWLTTSAPVLAEGRASSSVPITRRRVGAVIMVTEPWQSMLRSFEADSVAAQTGDAPLVWRKGSEAFVFSPYLNARGVESFFRRPLSGPGFESRVAREGDVAFGEYMNYRGQPVFGVARRSSVPGYSRVREIDRGEALSEYRRHRGLDWLVGALSFLLLGAATIALHRRAKTLDLEGKVRQQAALLELKQHSVVSEERFREFIESAEAIVWEASAAAQRFTFVSQGAEKILGYPTDQWLETPDFWADHLHPEDRQEALACEREVMEKGTPRSVEYRIKAADGRVLWFRDSMHPVSGPTGKVEQLRGIMVDITESKRAAQALKESEQRYRDFIQHSGEGVWRVEMEQPVPINLPPEEAVRRLLQYGYFAECNEAQAHNMGFSSAAEVVGKRLAEVFSAADQESLAASCALASEGQSRTVEFRGRDRAGNFKQLLRTEIPIIENGMLVRVWGISRDVTERQQAEEALRESEQFSRAIVASAQEGVVVYDTELRYQVWNRFMEELTGVPASEVLGNSAFDLFPHVREQGVDLMIRRALAGEVVQSPDMPFRVPTTGKSGWVSSVFSPHLGARGEIRGVIGTIRDITERKRADTVLQESEARYRTLFENAPVGLYRTTPDGRILAGNPAFVRMLGYASFEELAMRNLNTSGFEPDYPRSHFVELLEKRGEVAGLESVWYGKDGGVRHVRENVRAIRDDSGRILYYEGTAEDITERRRAEAEHFRLVTAIEQSAEAVVITDTRGEIEYVNPAFTRTTGYSREEAIGKNPRILKSGKQDPAIYQQLWETILKGQIWHGEIINQRKDGKFYTEEMTITPVRDARGEVTHFIATKQDVTERKTLEAHLQQAAKIEAVGRLAGGVAHDFNNLLTVINGYTELLLDKFRQDSQATLHLKEVKSAGERAATLTRQLLAFSRRQVLAPEVLDLNSVVSNVEKMLRRLIGEDVKLRTILDPALGRVKADPGQVEQVIVNLAVNARDAMPLGGSLTLETSNVELDEAFARNHATVKPGPHVMLAVGDTGTGMTPETQARIFEPFFTTKEKGKGTGLGLATVYGIVKQSGGSIWVYSELGQGTVFKIFFPTVSEGLAAKGPAKMETDTSSGTETVLVIEDEEGVRSLIRVALASAGYKVLETLDGEGALATCAHHAGPIHLLLTDVVMPQRSGPRVAQRVAALRPDIKVLYMSGYTDDAIVHHGVLTQEMPFIQKPFSPIALRKKIREVLDGK